MPPGTPVLVIATGNCEGSWSLDPSQTAAVLTSQALRLFAVAKVVPPSPIYRDGDYPLVDYFIILEFDGGSSRQTMRLGVAGGRIVSQFAGCGQPPENLDLRNYIDDYVIILRGPAYR
jgi:hypothetical protein